MNRYKFIGFFDIEPKGLAKFCITYEYVSRPISPIFFFLLLGNLTIPLQPKTLR